MPPLCWVTVQTMAERTSEKLMDAVADGAWLLLQHYVCRGYKTFQRGSGVGGIHTRHNAHQLYPVHNKQVNNKQMVSPAQATLEQVECELKDQNKQKEGRRNPVSTLR